MFHLFLLKNKEKNVNMPLFVMITLSFHFFFTLADLQKKKSRFNCIYNLCELSHIVQLCKTHLAQPYSTYYFKLSPVVTYPVKM